MNLPQKYANLKGYFWLHFTILKLFGISIEDVGDSFAGSLYKVYSVAVIVFFFYVFCALELIYAIDNWTDLENATFSLSYFLSHFLGICKLMLLLTFRKSIYTYTKKLEEGVFLPNMQRGGEKEFEIIRDTIRSCNAQVHIFNVVVVSVVTQRVLFVIGEHEDIYDAATNTTLIKYKKTTPFTTWTPFEQQKSPIYEFMSLYQITCASLFGFIIAAIDAFICGIMLHIKAQFTILKLCVEGFLERAVNMMESDGISIDLTKYQNIKEQENRTDLIEKIPKELQKYVDIVIADCSRHHQEILFLANSAESTFNILMLVQFLGSVLMLCFQLFQLSLYEVSSFEFFSMVCYLCFVFFQILVYCWRGNEVQLISESLKDSIYSCNWIVIDTTAQKALIMMMERAHRPIKLTAGKFAFLSLETFTKILRGSGSYFMVLRRMNE